MEANNLSFVYLNKEELSKVVKEAISEAIGKIRTSKQDDSSIGEFVSLKEAMKILGSRIYIYIIQAHKANKYL